MRGKNFLVHQHSNFLVCVSAPFRLSIFNLIEYVKIKNSFWTLAVFLNVLFNFFCFCKRSKWSPIYEFCRSSFFYFWFTESLFWENFAWRGLGKPKKNLDHQLIFFELVVEKNWSHASMWLCSQKEKNDGSCFSFFILHVSFFPEGVKKWNVRFFSEARLKIYSWRTNKLKKFFLRAEQ